MARALACAEVLAAGAEPGILADCLVDRRVAARPARARGTTGDALEAVVGAEALKEIAEGAFRYSGHSGP
ncbi:hypothetical protein ABZ800_28185 [Streptomyces sp. NPDC047813]|uniref:hypothetical protein n=1 Tax=Streptomyces sp. NPDC047813 TaxID=3154608 RepID=UPI0033F18145